MTDPLATAALSLLGIDASDELRRLREAGHSAGCQCRPCAAAREVVLSGGGWREAYREQAEKE